VKKVISLVRNLWASLPHGVQAGVVLFVSAAGASLGKILTDPASACWTWVCIKQYVGVAIGAGAVAVRAFYMLPNGTAQKIADKTEAQVKAAAGAQ
jgi:hypothetical protein